MIEENELAACVRKSLNRYFKDLDGEEASSVYEMALQAFEKPLLAYMLDKAEGNQTRASDMLGINRNTLRKKLKQYGLGE